MESDNGQRKTINVAVENVAVGNVAVENVADVAVVNKAATNVAVENVAATNVDTLNAPAVPVGASINAAIAPTDANTLNEPGVNAEAVKAVEMAKVAEAVKTVETAKAAEAVTPKTAQAVKYMNEPRGSWFIEDFNKFLVWSAVLGASDVHLIPGKAIWQRLDGQWRVCTNRCLSTTEISGLLNEMARSPDASARLTGGADMDSSYEVRSDKINVYRFRWNASACRDGWSRGITVVLRSIPSIPPTLNELGVEEDIRKHCFHDSGLILVAGVMGSGKSTLLSSILREIIENQTRSVKTFEAPIEFDLMGIKANNGLGGPVIQHEIPEHFEKFNQAARNTTRCASDVVLIGESRDTQTLRSMLEMSEVGVAAYSTVHTRGVAETPTRIINVFPNNEHNQIATLLAGCLKMVIYQRLLPKIGGGRIAVKEYLIIDTMLSKQLAATKPENFKIVMQQMLVKHGVPLITDVQNKYQQGLISKKILKEVELQCKSIYGENND